jgi:hypothetical protein
MKKLEEKTRSKNQYKNQIERESDGQYWRAMSENNDPLDDIGHKLRLSSSHVSNCSTDCAA